MHVDHWKSVVQLAIRLPIVVLDRELDRWDFNPIKLSLWWDVRAKRPTLGDGLSAAEDLGRSRIDLLFYNRNDLSMDRLDILIRIDDGGATWAARELSKESVADFFEVFDPPFLESVLAALDSGGCDRRIDVEHDRHVG